MNLSEFYRRGVVRPLDDLAAQQLANSRVEGSVRTEWIPILSDNVFHDLWESGLFQQVNHACGSEISDYEEVILDSRQLPLALEALRELDHFNADVQLFSESLQGIIADAIASGGNVYFIF